MSKNIPAEKYLEIGAHLGTDFKTGFMKKFIFKIRRDGLKIMDIDAIDQRLSLAAKLIAKYNPEKVVFVSRRSYGQKPAKVCAEKIGAKFVLGRFLPGLFTNPSGREFMEPELVFVSDPLYDKQAIIEAKRIGAVVVALCTTLNKGKNVDFVVPINNKGKKALALAYWSIAREVLKQRGEIKSYDDFTMTTSEFEFTRKPGAKRERHQHFSRGGRSGGRGGRSSGGRGGRR